MNMIKFVKDNIFNITFFKYIFSKNYNSIIEVFLRYLKEINLLLFFSRIFNPSIDRKIVCFGSMKGKAFIDNPKYLGLPRRICNFSFFCYNSHSGCFAKIRYYLDKLFYYNFSNIFFRYQFNQNL
ncbi:hypothetical protein LCGC14_1186120 [marine sediment metagenome]|uniref:Uncharacterized protein n=1 Tax=marine sediment metagenome TaxID=412755 RepID=A0A0F9M8H4_9ZZZZ